MSNVPSKKGTGAAYMRRPFPFWTGSKSEGPWIHAELGVTVITGEILPPENQLPDQYSCSASNSARLLSFVTDSFVN